MKIAYFDCYSGISGDMTLGAFIDAGLDKNLLLSLPRKLNLPQVKVEIKRVVKEGLSAAKVDVITPHEHKHRHLHHIEDIIDQSELSAAAKSLSKKIFNRLAEAEAAVHGVSKDEIHFHEVGALDAVVDICGAALAFTELNIEKVYSGTIFVGGGQVKMAHGLYPVPAPAAAVLLKGMDIRFGPVKKELVTPTGAAILSTLREEGEIPSYRVDRVGYGAGTANHIGIPNVLRLIIGEAEQSYQTDCVIAVECNIDDMNPQVFPYLIEKILEKGALEAYVTPLVMKKGRPGFLFTALSYPEKSADIIELIFRETTTIGVRQYKLDRYKFPRELLQVESRFGIVDVKQVVKRDGRKYIVPEFESCKKIARERNLSLLEVQKTLERELNEG
jgi:uncharacterized protein (TIGR00299 family) protein